VTCATPRPVPRVAFVLADLEAGGAQRVVLTVARHIDRERVHPSLVVVNPRGPLREELPEGVECFTVGGSRLRRAVPGLIRCLRRLRPDVILTTISHLNLVLLGIRGLLPRPARLLVREANTPSVRLRSTAHPGAYRTLYRRLYPRADGVLCNSEFMKKDMVRLLRMDAGRIHVLPNPVDTARIRAWAAEKKTIPFEPECVQLVSVGRLNRQKGYDLLLRAVRLAEAEAPGLHLTVVGEGEERARLEQLRETLGLQERVTFAGHRENPYPYMARADLFVSSSRYEGSPNAVLESLACGTPVLAFDCPGGTGEILREGRNGWLVPAEDTDAMAAKLVDIVRRRAWEQLDTARLLPAEHECGNAVRAYESLLLGKGSRFKGKGSRGKVQGERFKVQGERIKGEGEGPGGTGKREWPKA